MDWKKIPKEIIFIQIILCYYFSRKTLQNKMPGQKGFTIHLPMASTNEDENI